jgi:hypothetical protein
MHLLVFTHMLTKCTVQEAKSYTCVVDLKFTAMYGNIQCPFRRWMALKSEIINRFKTIYLFQYLWKDSLYHAVLPLLIFVISKTCSRSLRYDSNDLFFFFCVLYPSALTENAAVRTAAHNPGQVYKPWERGVSDEADICPTWRRTNTFRTN